MTTVQNWVDQTRSYLMSGYTENRNQLASPYTAGSGTLVFSKPTDGIRAGTRLSIGTNTFYVWSIAGSTASVSAGEEGSTDASATTGSLVRVAPRFTDNDILVQLGNEINDLSSPANGLYGLSTADFTYNPVLTGYDLGPVADQLISIYEVKYLTPGPAHDNPRIPNTKWRLNRNADTTQFPSGFALQLFSPGYAGFGVRVVYKSNLTMPTTTFANVASTGLQTTAFDIPPLGAAIRMMSGREIKRDFTEAQGDTRRGLEVQAGAIQASANGLQQLRARRIAAESAKLEALYPSYRS